MPSHAARARRGAAEPAGRRRTRSLERPTRAGPVGTAGGASRIGAAAVTRSARRVARPRSAGARDRQAGKGMRSRPRTCPRRPCAGPAGGPRVASGGQRARTRPARLDGLGQHRDLTRELLLLGREDRDPDHQRGEAGLVVGQAVEPAAGSASEEHRRHHRSMEPVA
jgi:hypothetical protein